MRGGSYGAPSVPKTNAHKGHVMSVVRLIALRTRGTDGDTGNRVGLVLQYPNASFSLLLPPDRLLGVRAGLFLSKQLVPMMRGCRPTRNHQIQKNTAWAPHRAGTHRDRSRDLTPQQKWQGLATNSGLATFLVSRFGSVDVIQSPCTHHTLHYAIVKS